MMITRKAITFASLSTIALSTGLIFSSIFNEIVRPKRVLANPSFFEYRWDNSSRYKKLYYWQSSSEKRDRSTYYLVVKPRDRRTAILKLSIKIPKYFDANISPKKLNLCTVAIGGMLSKTKCKKQIPAVFEVSKDQSLIEIFPDQPIPTEDGFAVVMKIFNPGQAGMFQFNALAQAPGDIPMAGYLGSWSIDVE